MEGMEEILTTCAYCGCGCGLYLRVVGGRVVGSAPSKNHPVSQNNLCVKGWHVHEFIHDPSRLSRPLIRKNGKLEPASWPEALARTAQGLREVGKRHGPQALGVLASAKCTNEENFLLQKLARAVLKTNNIDHCARL